jgi:hypothetical protein
VHPIVDKHVHVFSKGVSLLTRVRTVAHGDAILETCATWNHLIG